MSNESIKDKRIECLCQSFKTLKEAGLISTDTMYMSVPLLEETVKYYLSDMEVLKKRYSITDRIQLHKIAGLLTNAIVRVKPVVPIPDIKSFSKDSEIYANEILAIYEGLAICSEYDLEYQITKEPWFDEWFNNFIFMLHHRRHTAESLMFIFETVSRICFPNAFLDS
ncbi:MAG: hypothetical protein LBI42_04660 [Chitinispirillales bacterium]|jgi:hypothetical protein|nr:hypothetical protein [Chitinispirillales bacterium]